MHGLKVNIVLQPTIYQSSLPAFRSSNHSRTPEGKRDNEKPGRCKAYVEPLSSVQSMQVGVVSNIIFHVNDTRSFLAALHSDLNGSADG
jgi:hypothetical protein